MPRDGRENSIRIRLSDQEKEELENLAWRARKSVSEYVRTALKLTKVKPADEDDI